MSTVSINTTTAVYPVSMPTLHQLMLGDSVMESHGSYLNEAPPSHSGDGDTRGGLALHQQLKMYLQQHTEI